MLGHLKIEAAKYGLSMHLGKTKVLTASPTLPVSTILVGDTSVDVLDRFACEKYLGRKVCLDDYHGAELSNRIAAGWAAFAIFKSALVCKSYTAALRLKLFNSVVTPAVLYGCSSWAMKIDMERELKSTWRRMLRMMLSPRRQPEEDWIDYVQRSTAHVEALSTKHGYQDWLTTQRSRKWRFVGKVVTDTCGKWSTRLLSWRPWFRTLPARNVGRPKLRWAHDLEHYCGGDWQERAADKALWIILRDGYKLRM